MCISVGVCYIQIRDLRKQYQLGLNTVLRFEKFTYMWEAHADIVLGYTQPYYCIMVYASILCLWYDAAAIRNSALRLLFVLIL